MGQEEVCDATVQAPFRLARIGKHVFIYGSGVLLGKAVAFVMLPIYTRYLTPADYGILQLTDLTIEVISIVAGSRLGAGIFHYFHKAETPAEKRAVLSTAIAVLIASYTLAAIGASVAAPLIAERVLGARELAGLVRLAIWGFACQSLLIVPMAYLQLHDRSVSYVAVSAAKLVVQLGLNILLVVYWRRGAEGVLLSTLIANMLFGLALAASLVSDVGLHTSRAAIRDLLRFGLPFVATQVATMIATYGDRYFLRTASDLSVVGIYGLAYQFGFLLTMVGFMPFDTVWDPARFAVARRTDRDAVYARAFVYMNLLLVTAAVVLALFAEDILRLMAGPAFQAAANLIPIIVIAYVIQCWTQFHSLGILIRERTEIITMANWVGAGVALVGYAMLIPRWLGYGAAVATVASFAVREFLVYNRAQGLWPIKFNWPPVLRLVALATVVCTVGVLVAANGPWMSLALDTSLLVAYLAGVWFLDVLSEDDRLALRRFLRSPRATLAAFMA